MMKITRILLLMAVLLLAACTGSQAVSPTVTSAPSTSATTSTFIIKFTGNMANTLTSINGDKADFIKEASPNLRYALSFTSGDGQAEVQIVFYGSVAPQAGNYTFALDAVDGSVVATAFDHNSSAPRSFTLGEGQLSLEVNGSSYTGSFSFTSKGGEPGSLDQQITVAGTFKDVQLQG